MRIEYYFLSTNRWLTGFETVKVKAWTLLLATITSWRTLNGWTFWTFWNSTIVAKFHFYFQIFFSDFIIFNSWSVDFIENSHMRPREGHRGHLKGRMMFCGHIYMMVHCILWHLAHCQVAHMVFGCYLMRKILAIHYFHARFKILNFSSLYSHAIWVCQPNKLKI